MYTVTKGSCAGGSARNGGYKYAYSGKGDIPAGTLDITTLKKTNPIVRQFDDNFKLADPDYDYTIYICGTEEATSPIASCGTADKKFLMFSIYYFEIRFAEMVIA